MRVVIAGGHGKIALILEQLLSQRGDSVAGFIRNPDHADDLQAAGAEALVVDLEDSSVDEVAAHLEGADAVVFAAGAGPGSGAARKETVDRDAAILLADAAEAAKVRRYVMISAIGADAEAPDDAGNPVFVAYLRAKGAADDNVRARNALNSTIVRPGHLINEPGTGRVTIADDTGRGDIPR
jgi:nucleoside-diphosphate-sugar epimerase